MQPDTIINSGRYRAILANPYVWLAGVLGGCHLYCLFMMGATFWFDSIDYVTLGNELILPGAGSRFIYFQHHGLGEGFLWSTCRSLSASNPWLVLALVQHAFAFLATLYFLTAIRSLTTWPVVFVTGMLISLHPFLRAFDNSIMTESVSGSALLLYLGTDLRCLLDQDSLWNKAVGILAGIVGMQFRSYLFLFALAILGFTWLVKDRQLGRLRSTLILGLQVSCLAGGLLFFPCLRWLGTGHFYLPTADHWLLPFAVFNHPNLDLDSFLARPFRSETDRKYLEFLANNKLDYHQWAHLVHRMETSGQDLESLNRNFRQLAWAVRTDSLETLGNQFSLTLFSLGFSHVDFWFSPEHRINRSSKVKAWQEQNGFYYGWFSWTSASDYSPWFRDFVQRYRQKPDFYPDDAVVQLASALEPNLKNVGVKRKDPLHLAKIPPEAWFWGGIMGGLILGIRRPRVGFLLLLPVLMNYLVMLRCGLGGIRYVYWLLPTYILGATYFLASVGGLSVSWFRDRRWTFFRPAFGVGNQNPVPKVLLRNSDRGRG